MKSIGQLAHAAASPRRGESQAVSAGVAKLFLLMQGSYGTAFLSKFGSGALDNDGQDIGMLAALKVWGASLRKYAPEVIEAAADRIADHHPEFPPSLPQFEALCKAATPRKTYAEEAGLLALPAPKFQRLEVRIVAHGDGKDWARKILARSEAGDKTVSYRALKDAKEALGLSTRRQQEGVH
ncbi:hypothetical protein [Comamonas sp. AG1104]|uniref:hypothetical protein n=1 Tax=Comamonas sp. AG1104 TaxID=2183900 RepID=UPI000E0A3B9C|nr:hypothetical protein [Comamonas sp. AG1104]RDI11002.1 hypothetical protein DFO48_105518 [Comamonas sp. AG1104]